MDNLSTNNKHMNSDFQGQKARAWYYGGMSLWDVLFPRRCFGCGGLGSYICPSCVGRLIPLTHQRCAYCTRPSPHGFTHPGCLRKNGVDGMVSLYRYNRTMKAVIGNIKYRLVTGALNDLRYLMEKTGGREFLFLARLGLSIQPVPLFSERLKARGFNQSEAISRILSPFVNGPVISVVERIRATDPQAQLPGSRRFRNVTGAFRVKGPLRGKRVLLVDDVVTTGETVREIARKLKGAGAGEVYVFSVAKG